MKLIKELLEGDELNIKKITDLSPLTAVLDCGSKYLIEKIDVQTGLTRIDVCGQIMTIMFEDISMILDGDYNEYSTDYFWIK